MKALSNPSDMNTPLSWQALLKRVGWVLIVIGLVDIAFMAYCIAHRFSYSSSLNIFAVVAGVYLLRGSLRAANVIRWSAAFYLTGFTGFLLFVFPFYQPWRLWIARFHLDPVPTLVQLILLPVVIAVIAWTYRELSSTEIYQVQQDAGIPVRRAWTAVLAGVVIFVFASGMLFLMLKGEDAQRVISLAARIDGPGYRYTVTSMSIANGHVDAEITAYRSDDIRTEHVEFDE